MWMTGRGRVSPRFRAEGERSRTHRKQINGDFLFRGVLLTG